MSSARAAVRYSMATTRASPSTDRRSLRAADQPIDTWSSCIALLRRNVEGPGPDRHLAPEIEHAVQDVLSGALVRAVEDAVGPLA